MTDPEVQIVTELGGQVEQITTRVGRIEAALAPLNRLLLLAQSDYAFDPNTIEDADRAALTTTLETYMGLMTRAEEGVTTIAQILGIDIEGVDQAEPLVTTTTATEIDPAEDTVSAESPKPNTAKNDSEKGSNTENPQGVIHTRAEKNFDYYESIYGIDELPQDLPEDSIVIVVDNVKMTLSSQLAPNSLEIKGKHKIFALNGVIHNIGRGEFARRSLNEIGNADSNFPTIMNALKQAFEEDLGITDLFTKSGNASGTKYTSNQRLVFVDSKAIRGSTSPKA